jgi:hypothetical protein
MLALCCWQVTLRRMASWQLALRWHGQANSLPHEMAPCQIADTIRLAVDLSVRGRKKGECGYPLEPLSFVPGSIIRGDIRTPKINMRKIWQNDFSGVGGPFFTPQKKQKNAERRVRRAGSGVRVEGAGGLDLQGFFARGRAAGVSGSAVWRRLIILW